MESKLFPHKIAIAPKGKRKGVYANSFFFFKSNCLLLYEKLGQYSFV